MAKATTIKTTTKAKKTPLTTPTASADISTPSPATPAVQTITEAFNELLSKIHQSQAEFERLQREIIQIKQSWEQEQKGHQLELVQQRQQEELERRREREAYEYELTRNRKIAEDELAYQKAAWTRELQEQKDAIEKDRQELSQLRTQVTAFEAEKIKAVKEAQAILERQLTEKFENEKKLREQEMKSDKELLNLKVASLSEQNAKQAKEVESLKRALEEATRQVKDIAVKVIESGGSLAKTAQQIEA